MSESAAMIQKLEKCIVSVRLNACVAGLPDA